MKHIRYYILIGSLVLAAGLYIFYAYQLGSGPLFDIRLEEAYGFLSLGYIYIAILASPLYKAFPEAPLRAGYLQARRAIGVAGFIFALLHSIIAFFGLLQGFNGLGFLDHKYLVSLSWALLALIILAALAFTSFDGAVTAMGKWWKILQRFVYLVVLAILIHILYIGTHYANLGSGIAQITFVLLVILLFLEAIRLDKYLRTRFLPESQTFGFVFVIIFGLLVLASYIFVVQAGSGGIGGFSLNIHAQHEQEIQQLKAQEEQTGQQQEQSQQ